MVLHIQPKVFTDNQVSRIRYNYYRNNVSTDYDDSQRSEIAEDSITPQERQSGVTHSLELLIEEFQFIFSF
jgi:hypothetical protein